MRREGQKTKDCAAKGEVPGCRLTRLRSKSGIGAYAGSSLTETPELVLPLYQPLLTSANHPVLPLRPSFPFQSINMSERKGA